MPEVSSARTSEGNHQKTSNQCTLSNTPCNYDDMCCLKKLLFFFHLISLCCFHSMIYWFEIVCQSLSTLFALHNLVYMDEILGNSCNFKRKFQAALKMSNCSLTIWTTSAIRGNVREPKLLAGKLNYAISHKMCIKILKSVTQLSKLVFVILGSLFPRSSRALSGH